MSGDDFQKLLDAMQAELVAHREILAFLAFEVAEARDVDISDLSERLKIAAEHGAHEPVNNCVRYFADFIMAGQPPRFSVIDGGKE